jgi:hypothetical protein
MNEKMTIERIHQRHAIAPGSRPWQITESQQRAVNLIGKLLLHAHWKGRRFNGAWQDAPQHVLDARKAEVAAKRVRKGHKKPATF